MAQDEFDYHEFKKEIEYSLTGLSKQLVVSFAWRCGVRALPLLGAKGHFAFWEKEKRMEYLYSLFWALDNTASTFTTYVTDTDVTAVSAGNAAEAAYAATAPYAASSAASATSASSAVTYAAFVAYAATTAAYAADAAERLGISLTKQIRMDVQQNAREGGRGFIGDYGKFWSRFLHALEKEGCSYWGSLVQKWLETGFQIDEEALRCRLSVHPEKREQGAVAVAQYLMELEQGAKRLNEARIIILGDKGAGKTSTALKLVDPYSELPGPEESTPGVDITSWVLDKHDFNVRIWDFAGHTVTHAVHQFFLSERCLYILVCAGRTEEYNRLEYWLSQMQIYGGQSEVLILVNKTDKHDHSVAINKLKRKYPIVGLYNFSLREDQDDMVSFRERVIDYVVNNPSWKKQEIPEKYYKVKEKIESLFVLGNLDKGEEMINKTRFEEIAEELEVADEEILLRDLHDLGISLWYEDIEGVDMLVLNPEWISHGIYTIINWVHRQKQHGLSLRQFGEVFQGQKKRYPKKRHEFLFKLMKHYQLAFEIKKGKSRYLIIPHLLQEDQPDEKWIPTFHIAESLMLRYKSEIDLPSHTISRFIVRHHEEIKHEKNLPLVWREGVILEDGDGNIALVVEDNRKIEVSVKGSTKTIYLDRLRATLNGLFKEFKKQKPELQYRVQRYGELPESEEGPVKVTGRELTRIIADSDTPLWMNDQRILSLANRNIPHSDEITGQSISLFFTKNEYNINEGNLIQGDVGNLVRTQNNFNFQNCNINLQSNLNELSQLLAEKGNQEDAKELINLAKAVEEAEDYESPKEVQKKGIANRLKRFIEELADEKTNLHKVVKGVKNGISIAQDIAKGYNAIAQWTMMPQVPEPFLKKPKR